MELEAWRDGTVIRASKFVCSALNPHQTFYDYVGKEYLEPELISDESKRKIMWDNAVDFYRFPDGYLPTEFVEATELVTS